MHKFRQTAHNGTYGPPDNGSRGRVQGDLRGLRELQECTSGCLENRLTIRDA